MVDNIRWPSPSCEVFSKAVSRSTPTPHFMILGCSGTGKSLSVFKMALTKFKDVAKTNDVQLSELNFDINDVNYSLSEVQNILIDEASTETTFNIRVKHEDKILDSFSIKIKPIQSFDIQPFARTEYSKEEQMNDVLEHIKDISGINMTEKQLIALLNENTYIKEQLEKYSFYDTVVREGISDMISKTFVGEEWPKFGDNLTDSEFESFIQNIKDSASKMGYVVLHKSEE